MGWRSQHGDGDDVQRRGELLAATRPTAVNLRWAIDRVLAAPATPRPKRCASTTSSARPTAHGRARAALIADGATVLTHCNTGSLATGGIGTALGVIKTAHRQGKRIRVLVDETRPLLQGARLTAWELQQEGIPFEIIVDGAAAGIIARGEVQAVIVGADRIAANGDTANKVGTYGLALAARAHDVPFYVVAPVSTIDPETASGEAITDRGARRGRSAVVRRHAAAPEGARRATRRSTSRPPTHHRDRHGAWCPARAVRRGDCVRSPQRRRWRA